MVAERRARTTLYSGPLVECERRELPGLEMKNEYVAERKHDGAWCAWIVDHACVGTHRFESRTGLEFGDTEIDGLQGKQLGPITRGTTLVGELECASEPATRNYKKLGFRRFFVFDVIAWNGQDLRGTNFEDRTKLLRKVIRMSIPRQLGDRVVVVDQVRSGFLAYYDKLIAEGAEGLVLKKLKSPCRPTRADGKTPEMIRCKPWKTVDYIVMSAARTEKNELSAKVGLWRDGKPRAVLQIQLPDLEEVEPGKLAQEGQVVELYGREIFESGALRHAQFSRWRTDKRPEDCTGSWSLRGELR